MSLIVGGTYRQVNGTNRYGLSLWDGTQFSSIVDASGNTGFTNLHMGSVNCYAQDSVGNFYVGGSFSTMQKTDGTTGLTVNNIVKWVKSTSTWETLVQYGIVGVNFSVISIVIDTSDNVYVGGSFTTGGTIIAKWNPLTSTWSTLTYNGVKGLNILALDPTGQNLYVGGTFLTAGGVTAHRVAKWNIATSTWSALTDGTITGVSGTVRSLLFDSNGDLYIGGDFTTLSANGVASTTVNCVTKWNVASSTYSTLTDASGNVGVSLTLLAGIVSLSVRSMVFYNNELYIGGSFNKTGGTANITSHGLIKWNPNSSTWTGITDSLNRGASVGQIRDLIVRNNKILIVSLFANTTGNVPTNGIASWNGSAFSNFTDTSGKIGILTESTGVVSSIAVDSNNVHYVGGDFNRDGLTNIARWTPSTSTWSTMGALDGEVHIVKINPSGTIFIGGNFITPSRIARWNSATSTWNGLTDNNSEGLNNRVRDIAPVGEDLYIGGEFTSTSGITPSVSFNSICKWTNSTQLFSALQVGGVNVGLNGNVYAIRYDSINNCLYIGGNFTQTTGGTVLTVNGIVRYNLSSSTWSTLTYNGVTGVAPYTDIFGGINAWVYSIIVDSSGDNVYVAGRFSQAGGVDANSIARWNVTESRWYACTDSVTGENGAYGIHNDPVVSSANSLIPTCFHLLLQGDNLYVIGNFTNIGGKPAASVARWNITSSQWFPMGSTTANGLDITFNDHNQSSSTALAIDTNNNLIVGGRHRSANVNSTSQFFEYDGTNFSRLTSDKGFDYAVLTTLRSLNETAQTITGFSSNYNKVLGVDSSFSLSAVSDPAGATIDYTSSNPAVATVSGSTVTIVGTGTTTLTATATKVGYTTATADVSLIVVTNLTNSFKRSKLNLYDATTKSLHLELNQFDSSTQFEFPTNLNFTDGTTTILDVIDYLERVVSVENNIGLLQGRADVNESDIDVLEGRMDVNESDIDALEGRADINESNLVVLDERADSNASRLLADDAQLDVVEADIDALEARADIIEADIDALEGRADVNESYLVVLDERADSNASRLLADDAQLDVVESDIDALEGRASVFEADLDALEGRADVNESDLVVLDERADSNASRLLADDAQLDVVESDIDALEGRMSTAEADIVDLENSFTNYEADVVEIKGTLYAITDGNIESMLSSLHEITDSFASEINSAEDMEELHERLAELESVIQELTETM